MVGSGRTPPPNSHGGTGGPSWRSPDRGFSDLGGGQTMGGGQTTPLFPSGNDHRTAAQTRFDRDHRNGAVAQNNFFAAFANFTIFKIMTPWTHSLSFFFLPEMAFTVSDTVAVAIYSNQGQSQTWTVTATASQFSLVLLLRFSLIATMQQAESTPLVLWG